MDSIKKTKLTGKIVNASRNEDKICINDGLTPVNSTEICFLN